MNNLIRMMTAHATRTRKVGSITVTGGGNYSAGTPSISFSGGGGSGAAATANMGTTYVPGSVTSINGNQSNGGYTLGSAVPSVSFIPSGATATANFGSGFLLWISSSNARSTQQSGTITFSGGGGSGASASYYGGAGRLFYTPAFTIQNGGSGYTVAPTVSWSNDGLATIISYPSTTVNISGGQVVSITVNSPGEMISNPTNDLSYGLPTPSLTGGNGSGASIFYPTWPTISIQDYWVYGGAGASTPNVTAGSGYTSDPTPNIPGLVTGTVVPLMAKRVTSFTITNGGSYYSTNIPSISLSGGTSASAGFPIQNNWVVDGNWYQYNMVNSVTVTNSGTGYTSAPTVNFQAGNVTATAIANMVSE